MKTATAPLPPLRSVKVLDQLRGGAYATCITAYQPNRLMSTGFVPSSVFHGVRHPATLGSSEVRHFCLAGERAQGFGLHASSGIGGLAVLLRQGAVHGSATASGDRKTSAVAALAGGADPG